MNNQNVLQSIHIEALADVTGGDGFAPIPMAPGWFAKYRTKGIELQVKTIDPQGNKSGWRSAE